MMTRLVEDWDRQKCQEEEEVYRRLEDSELQQCAASVKQVADDKDNQGQVIMYSSNMTEHATKFKKKMFVDEPVQTETKLKRLSKPTSVDA